MNTGIERIRLELSREEERIRLELSREDYIIDLKKRIAEEQLYLRYVYSKNDYSHIKMSHYEGGNKLDSELIELLNEIHDYNPLVIPFIKYAHNHKGMLILFYHKALSNPAYSKIITNCKNICKDYEGGQFYEEGYKDNYIIGGCRHDDCYFLEQY